MLDLKAWAQDSPLYYARLRSAAVPNGVTRYGDEPLGGGSEDGQPPINIDALEASENEAVALWRGGKGGAARQALRGQSGAKAAALRAVTWLPSCCFGLVACLYWRWR